MPGAQYIVHEERPILLMDFTHIEDYGVLPGVVDEAIRLAHSSNARHSVLALIDLSGTHMSKPLIDSMKRMSKNNGPFMKAVAFVGLSLPLSLLFSLLLWVSGRRNHRVMRTRDEAARWLALQ